MGSGATSRSPAAREARIAQSVSARVWAVGSRHPARGAAFRFKNRQRGFYVHLGAIHGCVAAAPASPDLAVLPNHPRFLCTRCAVGLSETSLDREAQRQDGLLTRSTFLIATEEAVSIAEGRDDAEAEELGDGDPRHGPAGGRERHPVVARERLQHEAEGEERSAPSKAAWEVAPRWSRSPTESRRGEDGAQEEGGDARSPEDEDRSPPSQASAWSWAASGLEEEGGLTVQAEEPQLATRIPKELHRRLKLHCVTNDIAVMEFVVEALEKKLGRKTRAKKGAA